MNDFFPFFTKIGFLDILVYPEGRIANFGISLDIFSFCLFDDFFHFKKMVFGIFFVHPIVVLVLLSALVKDAFSPVRGIFCFVVETVKKKGLF